MTRENCAKLLREELDKQGLSKWHIRLIADLTKPFLGLCSYKDTCIIINSHHIDTHSDEDIINTIKHEVAHALCPGNGHDNIWAAKARELGCTSIAECSHLTLDQTVIDAIRSGANVEISFEEEIIKRPKYEITRLQDKCDFCGKVAKTVSETLVEVSDLFKPNLKFIKLECGHTLTKQIPKGTPFQTLVTNSDKVQDCKHQFDKNKCIHCGEFTPFQFQVEGMQFAEAALAVNNGVLIADEMGLGKTPQAIGTVNFHPEYWPVVVVAKSGLKFQWLKEFFRWGGDKFAGQIIQSSQDWVIPGMKLYIISYDMMVFKIRKRNGKEIKQGFDVSKLDHCKTVIIDECQLIKNPDASRTQQVRRLVKGKKVILLSGTPWKNRGSEYFTALNMVAPAKFPSYAAFDRDWVDHYWDGNVYKAGGIRSIERFREYTKDIVIRRERTEVMSELPLINRTHLYCQLDDLTQNEYDREVSDFVKWWNEKIIGGEEDDLNGMALLAKFARMRHITGLAKIPATLEYVDQFIEDTDRKIVVFVHHIDVGDIIYDEFKKKFEHNIPVLKLKGGMGPQERFEIQEKFNQLSKCILVASTQAAGEGLNLQTCADCILHERQWNPANEEQAEGRFIRIGQTSLNVNATYVTGEGTIDDLFSGIVERKRNFFHSSMNRGESPQWNQNDVARELAQAIVNKFKERNKNKVDDGKKKLSEILKV